MKERKKLGKEYPFLDRVIYNYPRLPLWLSIVALINSLIALIIKFLMLNK